MTALDALDETRCGEALRDAAQSMFDAMAKDETAQSPWEDVIGDDRDVFRRFADELDAAGFVIVRSR